MRDLWIYARHARVCVAFSLTTQPPPIHRVRTQPHGGAVHSELIREWLNTMRVFSVSGETRTGMMSAAARVCASMWNGIEETCQLCAANVWTYPQRQCPSTYTRTHQLTPTHSFPHTQADLTIRIRQQHWDDDTFTDTARITHKCELPPHVDGEDLKSAR